MTRAAALLALPFLFYAMLAEGNLSYVMVMVYAGVLCLLDLVPGFRTLAPAESPGRVDVRPLKVFLVALGAAFLIGMMRIWPALEMIQARGGLRHMHLASYPGGYTGLSWPLGKLLPFLVGFGGRACDFTVGWIPVILFGIALFASDTARSRSTAPWRSRS